MKTVFFMEEIRRRGGETSITERPWLRKFEAKPLECTDSRGGLVLLHCSGWRYYSRRYGSKRAALSYLCGVDDSGPWAVRVPGTITTIKEAADWVTPAAVKKAISAGKRVIRQGDVYAVETTKKHDGNGAEDLERHEWIGYCRFLLHPEHRPVSIPFPARFVQQRVYKMGRTSRRGSAD